MNPLVWAILLFLGPRVPTRVTPPPAPVIIPKVAYGAPPPAPPTPAPKYYYTTITAAALPVSAYLREAERIAGRRLRS